MFKKMFLICAFAMFFSSANAQVNLQKIDNFANMVANNTVIVNDIIEKNNQFGILGTEQKIKLDENYRQNSGVAEILLQNDTSVELKKIQEETNGLIVEIFVMDQNGLNVGMSSATSDFWQGDEEKFTETFEHETNDVYVSEIALDSSTQTFSYQYSKAIYHQGNKIGAVTLTVDVEKELEQN